MNLATKICLTVSLATSLAFMMLASEAYHREREAKLAFDKIYAGQKELRFSLGQCQYTLNNSEPRFTQSGITDDVTWAQFVPSQWPGDVYTTTFSAFSHDREQMPLWSHNERTDAYLIPPTISKEKLVREISAREQEAWAHYQTLGSFLGVNKGVLCARVPPCSSKPEQ